MKRVSKPIIIAEVGECFNGDRITAVKLIGIAAKAGCDIVKFQTLDAQNVADDDPKGGGANQDHRRQYTQCSGHQEPSEPAPQAPP